MRSTLTTRTTGLLLAGATALALTACGGDSDSTSSPSSTTTSSSSTTEAASTSESSASSTEAPSSTETSPSTTEAPASTETSSSTTEAPASTETSPSTTESSTAAGGDTGDKPSKEAVAAGTSKIFTEQAAKDTSNAAGKLIDPDKLGKCVADKGYDQLSPAFLKVLAEADSSNDRPGTANDRTAFTKLASECAPQSLKAGASAPTS